MAWQTGGKLRGWIWALCALVACDDAGAPPAGTDYDPSLVGDPGPPRVPPAGGGGASGDEDGGLVADAGAAESDAQLPDVDAPPELGGSEAVERLLIGDGLEPRLYAYDVHERRLLETFPVESRVRVYAGATGRYGYALPSAGGVVRILDMGLVQEDVALGQPRQVTSVALLDHPLRASGSVSLLAHRGQVALFFEAEARAEVLRESSLASQLESQLLSLGAPHRGFALPFGDGFLATRSEAGEVSLRLHAGNGALDSAASFDCVAPQGVALTATAVAIGCAAGVLRIDAGVERLIPYPALAGAPAARVGRLVAHPRDALYLTVLGEQLCVVGPSQLTCRALLQPWLDFGFDAGGKRALLLSRDGSLQVLDAGTLQPYGTLQVARAVSTSEEFLLPQLASGRRFTYVSDPQAATVHMVDPASLSMMERLELPGVPAKLAVFNFGAAR